MPCNEHDVRNVCTIETDSVSTVLLCLHSKTLELWGVNPSVHYILLREEGDLEKTRISRDLHSFGAGQIRFSVVSHGVGFSPRIGAKPNRQDTGFSPLLSLIYILEVLHTWTLFQGDNRGQRA